MFVQVLQRLAADASVPADAPGRRPARRRADGSCSSTGSPRPAGRGTRSPTSWPTASRSSRSTRPATAARPTSAPTCRPAPSCSARPGGRATYVGYSMGGRLCLHLAVARPELVERLVLVSATAGIDDRGERAARRASRRASWRRRSSATASTRSSSAGSPSRCSPRCADARARRPPPQHGRRTGVEPAARRHRHPGAAVGRARRR